MSNIEVTPQETKIKRKFVDLHLHTTYSDGELRPDAIINLCHNAGMSAIAITDHDGVEGYHEGKDLAAQLGIELIPGVELSTFYMGSEIHILGYLFDPTNLSFNVKLVDLQKKREIRARKIVKKLHTVGVEIRIERVMEKAKGCSVGRPHIAEVLLEEEYVHSFPEAFEKYLTGEFIKEFELYKLKPQEAIDAVIEAGGIAAMAHPSKTLRDDLIGPLVDMGLKGIETYCQGMDKKTSKKYHDIAKKFDLICCGGSDFHNNKGGAGFGIGSIKVPYSLLVKLKEANEDSGFEYSQHKKLP